MAKLSLPDGSGSRKLPGLAREARRKISLLLIYTENLHTGQVYSVEFGPAEKFFFRSLPGSVVDFEFKLEDLSRTK
jgi:hypothetical protein